jgi:hypothetical protein
MADEVIKKGKVFANNLADGFKDHLPLAADWVACGCGGLDGTIYQLCITASNGPCSLCGHHLVAICKACAHFVCLGCAEVVALKYRTERGLNTLNDEVRLPS